MQKLFRILAICLPAWAIGSVAAAETLNYNQLEFRESASVRVPNDTLNITLSITEKAKTRQEATRTVTRRLNALTAMLKGNRTFDSEIIGHRVYPEYDDKRHITGWRDTADIHVSSTDFEAMSKLIADSEKEAMITRLYYSVSPQKHAAAVEEASSKVLKAFRARAQKLSHSLGFGGNYRIIKIELNDSFDQTEGGMASSAPVAASFRSAKAEPAEIMDNNPGEQEIRQNINVSIQMY